MPDKIETREGFQQLLREALPGLIKENPQFVIDALAGNAAAMRDSFAKLGIFVSQETVKPEDVLKAHQEAANEGRIVTGVGSRHREAMKHLGRVVFDPRLGRKRVTYLWGEHEQLIRDWFDALLAPDYRHPKTGVHIREIAEKINTATRVAPATPLTGEIGTGGGYLVPTVVVAEIFEEVQERYVLQNLVQVFVSDQPLRIPRRTSLVTINRGGPATDLTEKDLAATLGAVELALERVGAVAYIDPQLAAAAAVGPVRYTVGEFAEAIAKDNQRVIVAGQTDQREPRGINSLPTAGGNAFDRAKTATWTDTSNATRRKSMRLLLYALSQGHRQMASFRWIANSDVIAMLAGLNDLDERPFEYATAARPETYLGREIVETTALTTSGGTSSVLEGDLTQYAWQESTAGLRMEQTREGGKAWESDTIGVKAVQWVDGAPVIPPAFGIMSSVNV